MQDQNINRVGMASLPDWQTATFTLHPLTAFSLYAHGKTRMPHVSFSSYNDTSLVRLESVLVT